MRIFGGTRDAADWARSRFLCSQLGYLGSAVVGRYFILVFCADPSDLALVSVERFVPAMVNRCR